MMKIGIDLVEHKDMSHRDNRFIKRVLSNEELAIYETFKCPSRKLEYLASRFACKEAIFKCYESSPIPFHFYDISILNKKNGAPYVLVKNQDIGLQISLSHTENYSIAIAIRLTCDDD